MARGKPLSETLWEMGIPEQTVYDTTNRIQRWTIAGNTNAGKLPRNLRKQYLNLSHEYYGNMTDKSCFTLGRFDCTGNKSFMKKSIDDPLKVKYKRYALR